MTEELSTIEQSELEKRLGDLLLAAEIASIKLGYPNDYLEHLKSLILSQNNRGIYASVLESFEALSPNDPLRQKYDLEKLQEAVEIINESKLNYSNN